MKKLDRGLAAVEKFLCCVTLIAMVSITSINVVSRFFFHHSLSFSEEITTGLFVLLSLLGSAIGVRKKSHLGLNVVTDHLPLPVQKGMHIAACLLGVGFCGLMTYTGAQMTIAEYTSGQITASLQWPEWIFGILLPVGFAFVTVRFLMEAVWSIRNEEAEEYPVSFKHTSDSSKEGGEKA